MRLRFKVPQTWTVYFLLSLILLLAAYTMIGERGVFHLWRLRGEKAGLDEQNFALQKENDGLRQKIWRLRHDDYYLEKIAREELNLVRPGEIIYRFPSSEPKNPGGRGVGNPSAGARRSAPQKP